MVLFYLLGCSLEFSGGLDETAARRRSSDTRPADSPDVLVVSVSGHCTSCVGWSYNDEYLVDRGTPQAFAEDLRDAGLSVEVWDYADAFYTWTDGEGGDVLVWGWLHLVSHLEQVRDQWVAGFSNPTRLVVIGHSHGVVWSHAALLAVPDLPVDALVDLDGVCLSWEDDSGTLGVGDDFAETIRDYQSATGTGWSLDLTNPCESWQIPGVSGWQNLDDVVPPSAAVNLEVRSADWWIYDSQLNWRPDGTWGEVYTWDSNQDHGDVVLPGLDALDWAVPRVTAAVSERVVRQGPWAQ